MDRYDMLVRVLDGIRDECPSDTCQILYAIRSNNQDEIWQARSRAYIHLYLKVMFGLTGFQDRENLVTDGGGDGGIDGYYIDQDARIIYLIQSKFRNSAENFEEKPITADELLSMEIKRILGGESLGSNGYPYNSKILQLQNRIDEISDLGRYKYKVIILANIKGISDDALRRITDNTACDVIDHEKSYSDLVFPVISGTLFKAKDINISIDISNKSAGSKIGYSVQAREFDCDITVVFAPTLEIARIMSHYKNSILEYNPRSYLEFTGEIVNSRIRETILNENTNEFALLNNGITIVCDQTGINEQSGRKNRAHLFMLNPQIINGGQTAYTLSRIYEDLNENDRESVFAGKEVLVKAIALSSDDETSSSKEKKDKLIQRISNATNSQSVVTIADKTSNNSFHVEIQQVLFREYGLLYERKRGEFSEGVRAGYVDASNVIPRPLFSRVYLAANNRLHEALRKRVVGENLPRLVPLSKDSLERFSIGLRALEALGGDKALNSKRRYTEVLPKLYVALIVSDSLKGDFSRRGANAAHKVSSSWRDFLEFSLAHGAKYVRRVTEPETGNVRAELRESRTAFSSEFIKNAAVFFK